MKLAPLAEPELDWFGERSLPVLPENWTRGVMIRARSNTAEQS